MTEITTRRTATVNNPGHGDGTIPGSPAPVSLLLVLMLSLAACSDNTLKVVSQAVADIATGTATVQQIAINGNTAGLISQADTATILTVCAQINAADVQVSALTRNEASLPAGQAGTIQSLLSPLVTAVQNAINGGVGNIKDPKTKQDITAAFALIQTGLAAAEAVLAK